MLWFYAMREVLSVILSFLDDCYVVVSWGFLHDIEEFSCLCAKQSSCKKTPKVQRGWVCLPMAPKASA